MYAYDINNSKNINSNIINGNISSNNRNNINSNNINIYAYGIYLCMYAYDINAIYMVCYIYE